MYIFVYVLYYVRIYVSGIIFSHLCQNIF